MDGRDAKLRTEENRSSQGPSSDSMNSSDGEGDLVMKDRTLTIVTTNKCKADTDVIPLQAGGE